MSKQKELLSRLPHEEIYLLNEFEDIAVKSFPGKRARFVAKPKGGNEYEIGYDTTVISDALLEYKEITKEQYEAF